MNATKVYEKLECKKCSRKFPFILASTGGSMILTFFDTPNPTSEQIEKELDMWRRVLEPIHEEAAKHPLKGIGKRGC
jgi:hypothetical protein